MEHQYHQFDHWEPQQLEQRLVRDRGQVHSPETLSSDNLCSSFWTWLKLELKVLVLL